MAPWHLGQVAVHNPFVPFNYVGLTTASGTVSTPNLTIDVHPSAKEGDILILGILGRTFGTCTDTRMTTVYEEPIWGWPTGIWVGYPGLKDYQPPDTGSGLPPLTFRPIDIKIQGANSGIGQFNLASMVAIRGEEVDGYVRRPLYFDPNRLAYSAENGPVPAIPGIGSGAIALSMSLSGFGGAYGDSSWSRTNGVYSYMAQTDNSYCDFQYGRSVYRRIPSTPSPKGDTEDGWRSGVIGLK